MDAAQEIGELCIDAQSRMNFAHLTGDHNPIHVDAAVGRKSSFGDVAAYQASELPLTVERHQA